MENNPDSPDSISGDQLAVDLLSPRGKRRRLVISDIRDVERRDQATPDINGKSTNNNDVGFVLMDEDHQENGANTEEEDEVCILT